MMKLSIFVTYFVMIVAKMVFTMRFYYLPSHYTLKTSISDKPILDFSPGSNTPTSDNAKM